MYVLTSPLDPPDHDQLEAACRRCRLLLRTGPVAVEDDLLAAFFRTGEAGPDEVQRIRRHGAYAVLVHPGLSSPATMDAVRAGYSLVLVSPLRADRLTALLGYLRQVAAPRRTQALSLDERDVLSTPTRSVRLEPGEAATLRWLGARTDQIVSRDELARLGPDLDPLAMLHSLREKFDEIGSGAQILKVPHMGFRLVGTVRDARSPAG